MSAKRLYIGKYLLLSAVLLLAGSFALFYYLNAEKRDEAKIRTLLHTLADDLSKNPQESAASSLLKIKSISNAFTDPASVSMDKYASGEFSNEQIISYAGKYRSLLRSAEVSVSDMQISIKDKTSANGFFSGRFSGKSKSGMSDTIVKDIEAVFVKQDGKWLIKSIKFSNVLH